MEEEGMEEQGMEEGMIVWSGVWNAVWNAVWNQVRRHVCAVRRAMRLRQSTRGAVSRPRFAADRRAARDRGRAAPGHGADVGPPVPAQLGDLRGAALASGREMWQDIRACLWVAIPMSSERHRRVASSLVHFWNNSATTLASSAVLHKARHACRPWRRTIAQATHDTTGHNTARHTKPSHPIA